MADHGDDTDFDPATFLPVARQKFGAIVDGSRKARKARHKAINKAIDGRSLRATGRTQQLNFKATSETSKMIDEAAKMLDTTKSQWLEQIVHEAFMKLKEGPPG